MFTCVGVWNCEDCACTFSPQKTSAYIYSCIWWQPKFTTGTFLGPLVLCDLMLVLFPYLIVAVLWLSVGQDDA